jgi:L-alanine-DL-glutamate epimerase-like enolase superfamily enzyme
MLSTATSNEFEQAMPCEPYEWGVLDPIKMDAEGFIAPHDRPGLGIEYDWEMVQNFSVDQAVCT